MGQFAVEASSDRLCRDPMECVLSTFRLSQFAVEARRHSYMASQHTASSSKAYRKQTESRSTRQAGKGGDEA